MNTTARKVWRRARSIMLAFAIMMTGVLVTATPAHAVINYWTWATSVNVRQNLNYPEYCRELPGTARCTAIMDQVNPWDAIGVYCQKPGQVIGGNPYWLWVITPRGVRGWMASYYINYPDNRLPNIPDCY
ncbi:hypothetical protein [Phytohabitans suffuscus]|uniref:SH3b domain-containing protein n=1 Tax=Phytohabitans suffuscus TaxID=624315 RepID=A0A6F8YD63_9ACTN|nr:hypothetical protein [Phytohabitans suffuscus]BCB83918.1 hypothetical protein Psuf_012310 [Phytohabitans suffuscus]